MSRILISLFYLILFAFLFSCGTPTSPTGQGVEDENRDSSAITDPGMPLGPSDPFVNRYDGTIGDKKIELVLINWGNGTLDGYYRQAGESQAGEPHGKTEFSGEIDLDESFYLAEYSGLEQEGIFRGLFTDARQLEGTWVNADSTRRESFFLKKLPSWGEPAGWEGAWYLNGIYEGGTLIIGGLTDSLFEFGLSVFRNGNNGLCFGQARYEGNKARMEAILFEGETEACVLKFAHRSDFIQIKQLSSTLACGFGMRAFADGRYENKLRSIQPGFSYGESESVFPDKALHDAFLELVGKDIYHVFAFNMQIIEKDSLSGKEGSLQVFRGAVAGMFTIHEAIIVHDSQQKIWAATLDFDKNDDPVIRYFTNVEKDPASLPPTIREWTARMPGYEVLLQKGAGEYQ